MLLAALIQVPPDRKMDKQIKKYSDNEPTMNYTNKKTNTKWERTWKNLKNILSNRS